MPPRTALGRRLLGGALVALAPLGAVLAARGRLAAVPETAPAYRQKGPEDARVVIVEFSDFQCPACRAAEEPLKRILELYGEKTRLVFKHYPLERPHPRALPAAMAAECAGRQGRFWELHRLLYDRQAEWSRGEEPISVLRRYARETGLDLAAFDACMDDPGTSEAVRADMREGDLRWVNATPTFFVNGRRYIGGQQLGTLGTLRIEEALAR